MTRVVTIVACVALFAAAGWGENPPAPGPAASQPTTEASAGGADSILHKQFTFTDPPAGWVIARRDDDELIQFVNGDQTGEIQFAFEPKDLEITGMGPQLCKAVKDMRSTGNVVLVAQPKVEKDKRFDVKIHDKFQLDGKTVDEYHVYRSIGPRVIEMTISTVSDNQEVIDDIAKTGQDMLAEMKFDRKEFLKQKQADQQKLRKKH